LARGPRREVLRGIMEEWREVTWVRMERWMSLLIDSGMLSSSVAVMSLLGEEEGLGLDQFHVEEHLMEFDERLLLSNLLL
jgi:hypothetical protein